MIDRPPVFGKWLPPRIVGKPKALPKGPDKYDRNDNYDYRWKRLAIAFRKRNPFCAECAHRGQDTVVGNVCGHIIPAVDRPEMRLDWRNLRTLCFQCNSRMAVIEAFARKMKMTDLLPIWCADPQSRPLKFRPPPLKRITNR